MPYIKLLTILAGLALLTACGGAAAPKTDNTGDTGEVNTTDCTATPFDTNCDAVESAITSRQTTCFASATANRRCGVVIEGACRANPFRAETACMADTYLPNRIAECIKGGEADEGKCATITTDTEKNTMITSCLKNPFDIVCKMTVADFATYTDTARMNRLDFCDNNANVANDFCTGNNLVIICGVDPFNAICFTDDTYLSPRITDCIKTENTGIAKCNTLLSDTAMNTELTDCLTNPFATACESVTAFSSSFALARTNRASFCDNSDNVTDDLCTGDNVTPICEFDKFTAICPDATYGTPRQEECLMDIETNPKCTGEMGIVTLFCEADPFNTETACGHGDYDDDRQTACLMDINEDPKCDGEMGIATIFCKDDPFHDSNACTADTYLPERIAECITTENTEDMKCDTLVSDNAKNTAITACLTNPFSDTCEADSDFMTYAETAQTNRASFCGMTGNDTNDLCKGAILVEVCGVDPFNVLCINNVAYLTNRQTHCVAGTTHTTCGALLSGFVDPTDITGITTPTGVIDHADLPATVAEATTGNNTRSFFLSIGADGVIDSDGLGSITRATLSREGDVMDGVTYVEGSIGSNFHSFIGLLPSTNLGAPLSSPLSATWEGQYFDGLNNDTNDITFTINFGAGDQAGTIIAMDDTQTFNMRFELDFTATGVITGIVDTNLNSLGTDTAEARGLIGEQGLVGAFANTDAGIRAGSLYGGFVADNPAFDDEPAVVGYLDWVDVTTPDTARATPLANQFLTGADSTTSDVAEFTSLNLNNAQPTGMDTTAFGGDADDGFKISGNNTSEPTHFYAGILTTTNLGAPLTETTASGAWEGRLYAARAAGTVRSTEVADFVPTVNFDTKTISATIPGVINFGGAAIVPGTVSYDFTAVWDERGVFQGTINRNLSSVASAGKLTGLIGADGAVGVFISNAGAAVGYGGGFVARKAPTN